MATPKKNTAVKAPLPITDKRSIAYRNSQKKVQSKGIVNQLKTKKPVHTDQHPEWIMEQVLKTGLVINASNISEIDAPWTINNLIGNIQGLLADMRKHNARLIGAVDSIVYIERKADSEGKKCNAMGANTVTNSLDEIKWQLKEISETYYNELSILEQYIGNTNKA